MAEREGGRMRKSIIDAALELVLYVKTHEYPKEGTDEFFQLTRLMDQLETSLRQAGILK